MTTTPTKLLFALWLILFLQSPGAVEIGGERVYSASELATLDRENEIWRTLRVDEDVNACAQRLRGKGFSSEDIARLGPQIESIWTVELERNFGWLSEEAIEKIENVDRNFIPRLRAIRLYEAVGIRASGKKRKR